MRWGLRLRRVKYRKAVIGALMMAMSAGALGQAGAGQKNPPSTAIETVPAKEADKRTPDRNSNDGIVIEPGELPVTYPRGPYQANLRARGNFVTVLQWSIEKGALPPG